MLKDYETFAGIKYDIEEMIEPRKAIEVAVWQLKRLNKIYSNDFKVISSYNMGCRWTDDGIYNVSYLCSILGTNRVVEWLKTKKINQHSGAYRLYHVSNK